MIYKLFYVQMDMLSWRNKQVTEVTYNFGTTYSTVYVYKTFDLTFYFMQLLCMLHMS